MSKFLAPLSPEYVLQIPEDPFSLIGWTIWFGLLVYATFRFRDRGFKLDRQVLFWLALLSILVLVFTPFFGIPLEIDNSVNAGNIPVQHVMFFAAVPWLVAGGMIGVFPAVMLAGMSGLLLAYLETHNIYTPLIFMTLAVVFTWSVRQCYRTKAFRLLRFPGFAALVSVMLTTPAIFLAQVLSVPGGLPLRIAVVIRQMPVVLFSYGGMVLIGGVVCVFVRIFAGRLWGSSKPLQPAPGEISMKFRLITTMVPIALTLLVVLVISNWAVAENNSRRILVSRLTSTSGFVAEGLPVFIETGDNLIIEMAREDPLATGSPEDVAAILAQKIESLGYFDQLVVMDGNGEHIASYPLASPIDLIPTPDEASAIVQSLSGVPLQTLQIPVEIEGHSARISRIAAIRDSNNQTVRVLWGQTSITLNPFSQPFLNVLNDLAQDGGVGLIVGEDGKILYHTDPMQVMTAYNGSIYATPTYFESINPEGLSLVQYYQPIGEGDWAVVVSLPAQMIQVMAWQTTYPLLLIGISAMVIVILVALIGLSPILKEIDQMKAAAEKVSQGSFDVDLSQHRASGEMGQLNQTFQEMVSSLRDRSLKMSDLSTVSERITGQLTLKESLQVIMTAAVERGVSSVRIILLGASEKAMPETPELHFGLGKHARLFAALDDEIMSLTRSQGPLVLADFQIGKSLSITRGMPYPASMIAMPLKWKNTWLGILWATYQDQTSPHPEDVDFFRELSHQSSAAIVNARAFEEYNNTRKQLESVLDILPDAVLISDKKENLIYYNQSAQAIFGNEKKLITGKKLSLLLKDKGLVSLARYDKQGSVSEEVIFPDGKAFHVIACPIKVDNLPIGQATIFKDITSHKVLESRKSEFVTTVSHELRSPLTLIHGYAKILRLTGNLNEQQDIYINNIIDGVDEMKILVQNLLDMGRLEGGDSLEVTRVGAGDLAQKVLDSMGALAKQKNIQMTRSLPENPLLIEADVTFLTQALKNLIENAIKFSKMGGEVNLNVRAKEDSVVFAVRDNGIGIAPLDQRNLFERFHRISAQAGQEQKGSGLGLVIVKSIAERHGGKVWLESQLGKGSTFYLQIPIKSHN